MKKNIFILIIFIFAISLIFSDNLVLAKVITPWQPQPRNSIDLQVAIYAEYGYTTPVSYYYDYSEHIINANDASNSNFFQSIQKDGSFGDTDKIMTYDNTDTGE